MATRTALRTRVQNNTGRTESAADTIVDEALQLAIDEVGQIHDWRDQVDDYMHIAVSGDRSIALPPDSWHLMEARVVELAAVALTSADNVTDIETNLSARVDDTDSPFTEATYKTGAHIVRLYDSSSNVLTGFVGTTPASDDTAIDVYNTRDRLVRSWVQGDTSDFASANTPLTFELYAEGTNNTGWQLDIRDKAWVVRRWPNFVNDTASDPVYGYVENDRLFLVPRPDGPFMITMTVSKLLGTDWSQDTDEIPIRGMDNAVVCWATSYYLDSIESFQLARVWEKRYEMALRKAVLSDRKRPGVNRQFDEFRPRSLQRTEPVVAQFWNDPFVRGTP